jgi:outer membrane cobalamin receptor
VRLGVRNLLDQHYQVFSSGIAAPGQGIYTSLHLQF